MGLAALSLSAAAQGNLFEIAPKDEDIVLQHTPVQSETNYAAQALGGTRVAEELTGIDVKEPVANGGELRAQLRTSDAPVLGLVLIPDWWGLTKDAEDESGFWGVMQARVVTVDLHGGALPVNRGEAARRARELDPEVALLQLEAAFERAAWGAQGKAGAGPDARPLPVAILGYGTGSDLALRLAARKGAEAAGVAIVYGGAMLDPAALEGLQCPVGGFFAERDGWITPDRVESFRTHLGERGLRTTFQNFNAFSGFALNSTNPDDKSYRTDLRDGLHTFFDTLLPQGAPDPAATPVATPEAAPGETPGFILDTTAPPAVAPLAAPTPAP